MPAVAWEVTAGRTCSLMCWMLYVGSDVALPRFECAMGVGVPVFVEELAAYDPVVCAKFAKPRVYLMHGYERCGCAFQYNRPPCSDVEATLAAKDASRAALTQLLRLALREQDQIELFICWAGDEGKATDFTRTICVGDLDRRAFDFRERERLVVIP